MLVCRLHRIKHSQELAHFSYRPREPCPKRWRSSPYLGSEVRTQSARRSKTDWYEGVYRDHPTSIQRVDGPPRLQSESKPCQRPRTALHRTRSDLNDGCFENQCRRCPSLWLSGSLNQSPDDPPPDQSQSRHQPTKQRLDLSQPVHRHSPVDRPAARCPRSLESCQHRESRDPSSLPQPNDRPFQRLYPLEHPIAQKQPAQIASVFHGLLTSICSFYRRVALDLSLDVPALVSA